MLVNFEKAKLTFLKDLQDERLLDPSLNHHKECMKFCFSGILQSELDNIKEKWNNHHIRNSKNAECAGEKPDVLYFNLVPAGVTDYKFPLAGEKLDQVLRICVYPFFVNYKALPPTSLIMTEENIRAPKNMQETESSFRRLITVTVCNSLLIPCSCITMVTLSF